MWSSWLTLAVVLLAVCAVYLSQTAARLDRLHLKVDHARLALIAARAERWRAVRTWLAVQPPSRAPSALASLADGSRWWTGSPAADRALGGTAPGSCSTVPGVSAEWPGSESTAPDWTAPDWTAIDWAREDALTAALVAGFPSSVAAPAAGGPAAAATQALASACRRFSYCVTFHDDAVASCQRMRDRRVTRLLRLAGYAPYPRAVLLRTDIAEGLARTSVG